MAWSMVLPDNCILGNQKHRKVFKILEVAAFSTTASVSHGLQPPNTIVKIFVVCFSSQLLLMFSWAGSLPLTDLSFWVKQLSRWRSAVAPRTCRARQFPCLSLVKGLLSEVS